jgi:hypothetical protein
MSFETAAGTPPRRSPSGRSSAAARRPPAATRSAATNDVFYLPKTTNRTAQNRRRRDIIAMLLAACDGTVSELGMVEVRRAAELLVAAETARAAMLNGDVRLDLAGLVKLENAARRTMAGLAAFGLKITKVSVGPSPGLAVARRRWAEQDKRKPDGQAAK